MHPQVRQMGPGSCPTCGMALEPVLATAEQGESPELRDMTKRCWIGTALTVPVFALETGGHLTDLSDVLGPQMSNWSGPGAEGAGGDVRRHQGAAHVAMESAGITLLKGDLMGMVRARTLSLATMRKIRQDLFLSFAYNVAGIPLAAGVLYPFFGLPLSSVVAAAAMALSSVSVIGNTLRLRTVSVAQ